VGRSPISDVWFRRPAGSTERRYPCREFRGGSCTDRAFGEPFRGLFPGGVGEHAFFRPVTAFQWFLAKFVAEGVFPQGKGARARARATSSSSTHPDKEGQGRGTQGTSPPYKLVIEYLPGWPAGAFRTRAKRPVRLGRLAGPWPGETAGRGILRPACRPALWQGRLPALRPSDGPARRCRVASCPWL